MKSEVNPPVPPNMWFLTSQDDRCSVSSVESILLVFLSAPLKAVYRIKMTVRVFLIPVTHTSLPL